jgi:hypothetical protein
METNPTLVENSPSGPFVLDYTTRLALLFVDICDYIGLPVNIPSGLLVKNDETISYGDQSY